MGDAVLHEVRGFLEAEAIFAETEVSATAKCIEDAKARLDRYQLKGDTDGVEREQYWISSWEHERESAGDRYARVNDLLTRYKAALDGMTEGSMPRVVR